MAPDDADFQRRMQGIEELVLEIESHGGDEGLQATAAELISRVMDLHGNGLRRIVEVLRCSGVPGAAVMEELVQDPLVRNLLVLYGLHPEDLPTRVNRGLESARVYLASHGGNVELLSVDDGHVLVRLIGNCHGCPSSARTMKSAVEEAIYEFAPDVLSIDLEQPPQPAPPVGGFVSLETLAR